MGATSRFLKQGAIVALGLIASVIAAEFLSELYAHHVLKHDKTFQPDAELGWLPLPNLDIVRLNSDGAPYRIQTDERGIRGPTAFPAHAATRRLLVLGDSFAFGEGVELHERFDAHIIAAQPNLSILDIGVPGFGTDQQIIRARSYLPLLRPGDAVLILLSGNDFSDIARTRHSGRSKPWFELGDGHLIKHSPHIGWFERLRDRSFLFSVVAMRIDADAGYEDRLKGSAALMTALLESFAAELRAKGIEGWIAFHGLGEIEFPFDPKTAFDRPCTVFRCVDLDRELVGRPSAFLRDRHWTAEGHGIVGRTLARDLTRMRQ